MLSKDEIHLGNILKMFNIIKDQGNTNTLNLCLTPVTMAEIKKDKCWTRCREWETLFQCRWYLTGVATMKISMGVPKKNKNLEMDLTCGLVMPLLKICSKDSICSYNDMVSPMFITDLFKIARE